MKTEDLKKEISEQKQLTENGAVGYCSTGKRLLDLNFMTSSLRNMTDDSIYGNFVKAFYENKLLAIKWLFFLRDIRGGCGERRSFRVILKELAHDQPLLVKNLIPIVSEFGRFDDLFCLLDTDLKEDVLKYIETVLDEDLNNMKNKKPITLLGKWLPSSYSKKEDKRRYANMIIDHLHISVQEYCKLLKKLRRYIDVVECKMSENNWDKINYTTVPSKANILYRNAFYRHDEDRRSKYLSSLVNGDTKINSGANFPHDIVHAYMEDYYRLRPYDESLEQLWQALPNYIKNDETTICVADGSGSMSTNISKSKITCLEVANALAIYFSERCNGEYKDKYITFSENPQLVDLSTGESLRDKINIAMKHDEIASTDIEAVFDLILNVAIKNKYTQEELPKNILILSDMEFDSATDVYYYYDMDNSRKVSPTLFDKISDDYKKNGYDMPRLIFWNLCSRTGTIPLKENDCGVALISGFSPAIMDMVLSNVLDPFTCLVEKLNSARYDVVQEAFYNAK